VAIDRAIVWKLVRSTPAESMPGMKNRPAVIPPWPAPSWNWAEKMTENRLSSRIGNRKEKNTDSFSREYIFSSRMVRSSPRASAFTTPPPWCRR
jgi:hypothetical protein